jgi:hypothetical protein
VAKRLWWLLGLGGVATPLVGGIAVKKDLTPASAVLVPVAVVAIVAVAVIVLVAMVLPHVESVLASSSKSEHLRRLVNEVRTPHPITGVGNETADPSDSAAPLPEGNDGCIANNGSRSPPDDHDRRGQAASTNSPELGSLPLGREMREADESQGGGEEGKRGYRQCDPCQRLRADENGRRGDDDETGRGAPGRKLTRPAWMRRWAHTTSDDDRRRN